jgi:acetyl esterase
MEGLDSQVRDLIIEMASSGEPAMSSLSITGAREQMEEFLASETVVGEVEWVKDYSIEGQGGDLPVRVYRPEGSGQFPVLLWFHGGGWTVGSVDSYDNLCRVLADELDRVVVSVEYRRAPEHEFPAALHDCYTALEWTASNAGTIDGDPNRVAVGGDSAGGNLATATALRARDEGGPSIEHQLLAYPATSYPYDPDEEPKRGYFLERPDVERFWSLYLGDSVHGENPYAAPLKARGLSGLPAATVLTCEFDPLHEEGVKYADRLDDAGVSVTHIHFDDVPHGFLPLLAEPKLDRAWDAIERFDQAIGNAPD